MYESPLIEQEYPQPNVRRLHDLGNYLMKTHRLHNGQPRKVAGPTRAIRTVVQDQPEIDFVPSPDEVARMAYLSYLNQGSLPGHDVQHWLEAEQQLLEERNRTRVHGFHNRT
jgi:hypothetical protein